VNTLIHDARGTNRLVVIETEDAADIAFDSFMALGTSEEGTFHSSVPRRIITRQMAHLYMCT
jgi:hypothetical protein